MKKVYKIILKDGRNMIGTNIYKCLPWAGDVIYSVSKIYVL